MERLNSLQTTTSLRGGVNPFAGRPFVSARNAAFRLGEKLVFEHLTWRFHRDEHWAIVGDNGSGKSVLADALRGRLALVRGELRYHFRPPPGLAPEEVIGHVAFEDRKLDLRNAVVQSRWNSIEEDEALRVRDFLAFERVMEINPFEVGDRHEKARPPFTRRLERAVRWLRLEGFWDRTLLSLSNGERQRAQLAQALCLPLRLLILDEPFTGLDTAARAHFCQLLDRLMDTSLRVLLITTRMEELPRRLTHLLWVRDCRVAAAGPREAVLAQCQASVKAPRSLPAGSPPPAKLVPCSPTRPFPPVASTSARKFSNDAELVRLRNVTVRYGASTILKDIDWSVRVGESWALLGPNGSGKTTLLSVVLGDNPQAYNNDVTVFGRRRGTGESIWDIKRRIGWVSPELHLHFDDGVSCLEAVVSGFFDTVGLFEPPNSRQRAAARRWLARFGLVPYASTPLYALSAGLQRMVLLARALVKRPRLLILDEPCQGLDAAHRSVFLAAIDDLLREAAVTALFVTHRREEIPSAIRRVLRLENGTGRVATRERSEEPAGSGVRRELNSRRLMAGK